MDIVYKPVRTALVKAASERGARVVHGGRMLLYQAAAQFELYTGRPAPLDVMDAALAVHVRTAPRS
jgi:shikimate dehydrogenase